MARPTKTLTAAQLAEVETLAAVLTTAQIADYFGIGRSTFFAIMERDPEVAGRYKRGKARAIGAIAQSLITKARGGDTASMIFYLKTQAGWRETAAIEHSGPAGAPIPVSDARDRLFRMLDEIAARRNAAPDRGCLELQKLPAGGGESVMRQSPRMSLVKAFANLAVGFALAVLAQLIRFPVFGLIFTLLSILRGFARHRLFERRPATTGEAC